MTCPHCEDEVDELCARCKGCACCCECEDWDFGEEEEEDGE